MRAFEQPIARLIESQERPIPVLKTRPQYLPVLIVASLAILLSCVDAAAGPGGAGTPASGGAVFSKSPIKPSSPGTSATSFEAGDYIYMLMQAGKSWKELYEKDANIELMVQILVDGERITGSYVTLTTPELAATDYLLLDIAPKPSKMTAYKNPDIKYATHSGEKYGPQKFTQILSGLSSGKHSVTIEVYNYGKTYGSGTFEIEGSDYGFYSTLNAEITKEIEENRTLPPTGMVDASLEDEMRDLAVNGGWKKIQTLYIQDKDWWVESGVGRHVAAVIAAKDDDGKYYYSVVTFKQDSLLAGWGPLRLDHTGPRIPVRESNLRKAAKSGAGGNGSTDPFFLFRLMLGAALLLSGILLASEKLKELHPGMSIWLEKLAPIGASVGVLTLACGLLFFIKNVLTLSPLADILPQGVAMVAGLYLGLDVLLKLKKVRTTEGGSEGRPSGDEAEAGEQQSMKSRAHAAAKKAGVFASKSIENTQRLITANRSKIEMLGNYEFPLGAAGIVLGLLHLLAGEVWML